MSVRSWSKSNVDYGLKVVSSGIKGARSGRESFLNGESLAPFLNESVPSAVPSAILGALIGVIGSYSYKQPRSFCRTLAFGLLGGAVGLGAGIAWESRRLARSVASGAWKGISQVCDEHWLEKHPIDYA